MVATDTVMPDAWDVDTIQAVVFDCYGTLIDFDERAFAPAVAEHLRARGIQHVDGESVWNAWLDSARTLHQSQHPEPERPHEAPEPPFEPFVTIWRRHFVHAFAETGVAEMEPEHAVAHLFDQLSQASAYPEVVDVLTTLHGAGIRLAVASNADDAHLLPTLARAGITIDTVFSSESLRGYKPRSHFFQTVAARLQLQPDQILYVGDSPVADVSGSRHAGMASYWVRRYDDEQRDKRLHYQPQWTYPDLRGLLTVLLAQPA